MANARWSDQGFYGSAPNRAVRNLMDAVTGPTDFVPCEAHVGAVVTDGGRELLLWCMHCFDATYREYFDELFGEEDQWPTR